MTHSPAAVAPPSKRPESQLVTLRTIAEAKLRFHVPIYQRLYVWGPEQVDTLLHDLWSAFDSDQTDFYLGGTLVVGRPTADGEVLELIDGQQRFTTLWMMSLAWGRALEPFAWLRSEAVATPRVAFPIRADVDAFFRCWPTDEAALAAHPPLVDALARIAAFLQDPSRVPRGGHFAMWVYERVELVLTRVPAEMDLNRLYEVINSRGQQLRHHDILKARLLARLPADERHVSAQLWEASSDMGAWVERALKEVTGLRVRDLLPERGRQRKKTLASAATVRARLMSDAKRTASAGDLDLATILGSDPSPGTVPAPRDDRETIEVDPVRSIVSFPMLLQHTLRVWLHTRGRPDLPRVADKELLALFEAHFLSGATAPDVSSFVDLLWELRVLLDRHVVKWIRAGDDERLALGRLRIRDDGRAVQIRRELTDETTAFGLLQAMLYHSQQITTHYWLTPLLAYLHRHRPKRKAALAYLRHLDNHLLCRAHPGKLVEMSRQHLDDAPGSWHRAALDCGALDEPLGVGFPHYWFYKLEFVLWDDRKAQGLAEIVRADALRTFRITARSSVEHISPQTPRPEDRDRVSAAVLDAFGNLALVTRSINSEYGSLPFTEKRARFRNRNDARVDSLKMALVYRHRSWSDRLARRHQREMARLMRAYLDREFGG